VIVSATKSPPRLTILSWFIDHEWSISFEKSDAIFFDESAFAASQKSMPANIKLVDSILRQEEERKKSLIRVKIPVELYFKIHDYFKKFGKDDDLSIPSTNEDRTIEANISMELLRHLHEQYELKPRQPKKEPNASDLSCS